MRSRSSEKKSRAFVMMQKKRLPLWAVSGWVEDLVAAAEEEQAQAQAAEILEEEAMAAVELAALEAEATVEDQEAAVDAETVVEVVDRVAA